MMDLEEILLVLLINLTIAFSTLGDFPSRAERDTYDEREKLLSTYKIISKSQCLLRMRSFDGYVHGQHIANLHDSKETNDGKKNGDHEQIIVDECANDWMRPLSCQHDIERDVSAL